MPVGRTMTLPEAEQVEFADQLLEARIATERGHFGHPEDVEATARDAPGLPPALDDPSGPDERRVERGKAGFEIGGVSGFGFARLCQRTVLASGGFG